MSDFIIHTFNSKLKPCIQTDKYKLCLFTFYAHFYELIHTKVIKLY